MNFPNLVFPKTIKNTGGAFRIPSPKKKQEGSNNILFPTPKNAGFSMPASILYFNYFNQFLMPQNNNHNNGLVS